MHKPLLSSLLILSSFAAGAQSLVLAKQFHGNDTQSNYGTASDASGNIYTICNFWDDVDADPGPGTTTLNAVASMDIALIKLNSAGDLVWAKQLGGTGFDGGYRIATDANGDVFVFGIFNGTLDMDPSGAVYNLVSAGTDDVFCGKYDDAGNFLWAARFGGTSTEQAYGFDLNSEGHPFLHGFFQNTVDFNPGPGTFNLTAGFSGNDFLVELDGNGGFISAISMSTTYGNYLMIDPFDNIYITGLFWGTMDFDPGPGVHNLVASGFGSDAFLLKLDGSGSYLWAGSFSGVSDEQGVTLGYDVAANDVVIGGFYQGTIDTDPGGGVSNITSAGYVDAFVIKLNDDGSFIWGKGFGGLGYQQVTGLQVDQSGNIHMTGPFEQTADFDPSGATNSKTSNGYTDFFRLIWTSAGNFTSVEQIGGTGEEWSYTLEFDNEGAELITGHFENIVDFDPGVGTTNLNAAFTGWDGFISKYCTVYTINNNVAICEGESYFAGGAFQTTPGDYFDYFDPVEGCDSIVITHLSVNDPAVNLGPNETICEGETLVLNAANPGADYLWTTGAETQTINVTATGTYGVVVTTAGGCTATDEITITVAPAPNVNLGPNIEICEGETVVLDAGNPGLDYAWNTGAETQTITVSASGNYGVVVTNGGGCSDNDMVTVTVHANPVVDLGDAIEFCSDETLILDADNPGATYEWTTGAETQEITVTASGTYGVEVTNIYGCTADDDVVVTALAVPVVDLGDDITVCDGETVNLNAGNPGADYLWSTGQITQVITVNESDDYSVVVTNDAGCSETDMVSVTVNPVPVVDLDETIVFCENISVILDAENPGADYLWTTGATTQQIVIDAGGTYGVTVTNIYGCVASSETVAETLPVSEVDLGADTAFCDEQQIILDATTPECTYAWSTGATSPEIFVNEEGNYWVIVTNTFGCSDTDEITIETYPLPDVALELPATTACLDDDAMTLSGGSPDGGYYTVDGDVSESFDPGDAGIGTHTVVYAYTDANGCSSSATQSIEVTVCQGIGDEEIQTVFNIYPNPTMDQLHITIDAVHTPDFITIRDITGNRVFADVNPAHTSEYIYDVSFLPGGNYIVEVSIEKTITRSLLVVSK